MNLGVHSYWYVCLGCHHVSGRLEEPACFECGDESAPFEIDLLLLATLSYNLAIGAALCRAFWLGDVNGLFYMDESRNTWRPGCGRSAP